MNILRLFSVGATKENALRKIEDSSLRLMEVGDIGSRKFFIVIYLFTRMHNEKIQLLVHTFD